MKFRDLRGGARSGKRERVGVRPREAADRRAPLYSPATMAVAPADAQHATTQASTAAHAAPSAPGAGNGGNGGGGPRAAGDPMSTRVDVINTDAGRILCVADVRGEATEYPDGPARRSCCCPEPAIRTRSHGPSRRRRDVPVAYPPPPGPHRCPRSCSSGDAGGATSRIALKTTERGVSTS